jgi:retinol dehydrogenase-12
MRLFVGHFYLTKLLLPVLKAAAKGSPAGTVRVVNMSSIAHYMSASEGIRWTTLGPGADAAAARKKLGVARLFGQSKLVKLHNSYVDVWHFLICGKGQYPVLE